VSEDFTPDPQIQAQHRQQQLLLLQQQQQQLRQMHQIRARREKEAHPIPIDTKPVVLSSNHTPSTMRASPSHTMYISNFEKMAGANELSAGVKATAYAAPLKGSALMVANEYFEAKKAEATFEGLKEGLVSKIDFKRTNTDKIRFSALKLKNGVYMSKMLLEL
jgi:hypothetical protein